jgi:glycosyltransferase involved in cell wall biosynthesis
MLTIIVPVFDEEKTIENFHRHITKVMDGSAIPYTILYVDDGSRDGTRIALERLGAPFIFHDRNMGYGAAIKSGIMNSTGDLVAIIDCDNTYDPAEIPKLYAEMISCDMAVGRRPRKHGIRNWSKAFLCAFASYAVSYPIPDLNSGLRIFKREIALRLFKTLPNGFSLTSTITLGALYTPYRVRFVPISYGSRTGHSKIRPLDAFVNFIMLIVRTIILFNPLKFFLPVACLFGVVGIGFLIRDLFEHDVAQASLLMIINAVILLTIGLLAEAIRCKD